MTEEVKYVDMRDGLAVVSHKVRRVVWMVNIQEQAVEAGLLVANSDVRLRQA
jgi:hypothetical protein